MTSAQVPERAEQGRWQGITCFVTGEFFRQGGFVTGHFAPFRLPALAL
jgi:hypothetical protein